MPKYPLFFGCNLALLTMGYKKSSRCRRLLHKHIFWRLRQGGQIPKKLNSKLELPICTTRGEQHSNLRYLADGN